MHNEIANLHAIGRRHKVLSHADLISRACLPELRWSSFSMPGEQLLRPETDGDSIELVGSEISK